MRDYRKLKVFGLADQLVLHIYETTRTFPKEELFGLISQMRRAVLSVVCNIVEGCSRHTEADYLHFLDMAYGSAHELQYLVSVAVRLKFIPQDSPLVQECESVSKSLGALINALRKNPKVCSLKPKD